MRENGGSVIPAFSYLFNEEAVKSDGQRQPVTTPTPHYGPLQQGRGTARRNIGSVIKQIGGDGTPDKSHPVGSAGRMRTSKERENAELKTESSCKETANNFEPNQVKMRLILGKLYYILHHEIRQSSLNP